MAANNNRGILTVEDETAAPQPEARTDHPVTPPVGEPPSAPAEPAKAPGPRKLGKKERKLLKDAHRPLDSWERYRALTDVLDEAIDLVDLADHKARFALVIMGALNALLFILASQTDVFDAIPPAVRPWMGAVVVVYALVAVYFVIQAIESLRPRKAQPQVRYASETGLEDFPVGLRFYEDILSRDVEAYRRVWRELRMGQLNAELAVQAHALAQINKAKYNALRRLYFGLQLMTVMAVLLMAVGAYFVLSGKAEQMRLGRAGWAFKRPQVFHSVGVKEPSGVAFHPRLGHLFLVGDDGKLAELELEGRLLRATDLRGNLEDVTVHGPSGALVVLAELSSELIVFDPVAHQEKGRFQLDHDAVLGQPRGDRNQGFEGLSFRPDPAQPGGGFFYLVHQRDPAMVVVVAFDPAAPGGKLGAEAVKTRWPIGSHTDLTAITYSDAIDRLLMIAEKDDRLLVLRTDGSLELEIALPGKQQEGLAFDSLGRLWVADDRDKSLLRLDGALDSLRPRTDARGTGLRVPG